MGGSASAQLAYYSHSSHQLVYGSQSPAEKNKLNVLLYKSDCKNICPGDKHIKNTSQENHIVLAAQIITH